eukprot:TRINITY_DN22507_c0_g1_i1.p1 TRINITY_DN22507_c0_g1~~TRINITY_DN22507_c0_g1_i1.p1  ORF type:complete len:721 (+),score=158.03 TRINITY_DN22507_c0_g1_i1:46-2163(+)
MMKLSESDEITEMRLLYDELHKFAVEMMDKKVDNSGKKRTNVNQYNINALKESEGTLSRIRGNWEHARSVAMKRASLREFVKILLLQAELHGRCAEASEGYKTLETARKILEKQQHHESITKDDLYVPEQRRAATAPKIAKPEAGTAIINCDLLIDIYNRMGTLWSGWGELTNAKNCFESAEQLHTYFASAVNADRQYSNRLLENVKETTSKKSLSRKMTIDDIVAESTRRESEASKNRELEREEQQRALAERIAAKKEKRKPADTHSDPSPDLFGTSWNVDDIHQVIDESELHYTKTCRALAQIWTACGNPVASCFYCHMALRLESLQIIKEGGTFSLRWIENCISLADYYTLAKDFSHAKYCLDCAAELLPTVTTTSSEDKEMLNEVTYSLKFCQARYGLNLLRLLQRESDTIAEGHSPPANLDGIVINILFNKHATPPPEERELLKSPPIKKMASERIPFAGVSQPDPVTEMTAHGNLPTSILNESSQLYKDCIPEYTVDTECEKHCLIHLELQELLWLGIYFMGKQSETASKRLDLYAERIRLLQVLIDDGFDELVFRNVLRQVHFALGTTYQEMAELVQSQGMPAADQQSFLVKASSHYTTFSERFIKEFKDTQKASSNPRDRTAVMRLEGSDAPAFVVGEIRHAQVLSRFDPPNKEKIISKYKSVARFIETNPKSVAEFPELKDHLRQVKEMIRILQQD